MNEKKYIFLPSLKDNIEYSNRNVFGVWEYSTLLQALLFAIAVGRFAH